jgi:hypothetical protein
MTRITNVDHALLLLHAQLQRSQRSRSASNTGKASPNARSVAERIRTMAADGQASPEDLKHALVTNILIDAFGSGAADDSRFQSLVTNVMAVITTDEQAKALLDAVLLQAVGRR